MTDKTLLVASQVAEMIDPKRWTRTMVHTYLKRGKFPEPTTYIGNQPVWTPEQIERFKNEKEVGK